VSNLSFGSGGFDASSSQTHPPHVSLLSQPGTRPGIQPVIRKTTSGGPVTALPLSCCLSAAGVRFLGVLFPLRNWALLTVGLPRHHKDIVDPDGVPTFHTHEIRLGRVPSVPRRRRCSHGHRSVLGRRLPTLSGWPLISLRHHNPTRRVAVTRHQRGFTSIHPSSTSPHL
jgi:hypothetical protein